MILQNVDPQMDEFFSSPSFPPPFYFFFQLAIFFHHFSLLSFFLSLFKRFFSSSLFLLSGKRKHVKCSHVKIKQLIEYQQEVLNIFPCPPGIESVTVFSSCSQETIFEVQKRVVRGGERERNISQGERERERNIPRREREDRNTKLGSSEAAETTRERNVIS